MKKSDIDCYRINYAKSWNKYDDGRGFAVLPLGIIAAIHCLCDEVERLQRKEWRRAKNHCGVSLRYPTK